MRALPTLLLWIMSVTFIQAQSNAIKTDIFGDLQYKNLHNGMEASLKKDLFDKLTYSDNKANELSYDKKYLNRNHPEALRSSQGKTKFFQKLIRENRRNRDFKAQYGIDIFDQFTYEDNRGKKIKEGKNIFGHTEYESTVNGSTTTFKRELNGSLRFKADGQEATLAKNIHGKWVYKDNIGNNFEFGAHTWQQLIADFGNDEEILMSLVDQYLH